MVNVEMMVFACFTGMVQLSIWNIHMLLFCKQWFHKSYNDILIKLDLGVTTIWHKAECSCSNAVQSKPQFTEPLPLTN